MAHPSRIWGTQALDFPSWSIQVEPDELETKFWEDRRVAVYDIDVAKYVIERTPRRLLATVCQLPLTRR